MNNIEIVALLIARTIIGVTLAVVEIIELEILIFVMMMEHNNCQV